MSDKKIVIVGATSGIGAALASTYAHAGWIVGATGRRAELLETLKAEFPNSIFTRPHDVTASDSISILEDLVREMNGVDVIVYNSGIGIYNKNLEWHPERDTIAVNVSGFTEIAIWAFRYFRQRGSGHFVGVSSVAAERGNGKAPAYNASKAFMANYMEGLRQQAFHSKKDIFITDIRPGFVDTPMTNQNKGMFWVAQAGVAARQIMSAIDRKKRVAYVTRRWALVAWLIRRVPRWVYEKL